MIRFAAISLLIAYVLSAPTGLAFEINRPALEELKRIDGYDRFFEVHQDLFIDGPLEGMKNYLVERESALFDTPFDRFREKIFLKPCREITQLYNRYKEYFDELPSTLVDFNSLDDIDRNLLCRVFPIVKDCKLYTEHSFSARVHVTMLAGLYLDTEVEMID